jgi:hypothetical protein
MKQQQHQKVKRLRKHLLRAKIARITFLKSM